MECYYFPEKGDRPGFTFLVAFALMPFSAWNAHMMAIAPAAMLRPWVDVSRLGKAKQNYRCHLDRSGCRNGQALVRATSWLVGGCLLAVSSRPGERATQPSCVSSAKDPLECPFHSKIPPSVTVSDHSVCSG